MRNELQSIAESLAASLGRAVAVDDPHMRLIVHTSHHGEIDEARRRSVLHRQADAAVVEYARAFGIFRAVAPVRIPADPSAGLLARVCVPVRFGGALLGFLWLIDADGSLTDEDLRLATEAAVAAGVVLHREQMQAGVEQAARSQHLLALLQPDAPTRRAAAEALRYDDGVVLHEPVRALLVDVSGPPESEARPYVEEALDRAARRVMPAAALQLARGLEGVLLLDASVRDPLEVVSAVRAAVNAALPTADVRAALGDAVDPLDEFADSYVQARHAVRVSRLVPGSPPEVAWSQLGVYRLLAQLPRELLDREGPSARVLALLGSPAGCELVRTVEVYLDNAGDAQRTAAALSVHRTSLYYRLARFQELAGVDLSSGEDRLTLHLGLRMARLSGAL